ncbi:hypothetical protein NZK32_05635 [Cyanobium sp. FGCU-52]|nr:hypothetical protein [Cyanobium sp. FGCU52]
MIRLTLASNALHLEAARRLRRRPAEAGDGGLELLIWEPRRMRLGPEDRRFWPLRLPVHPLTLALLVPLALAGAVRELRLAHLRNAGRALRRIAARSRRLVLLDDGLDQYRDAPRAVDPRAFPEGIDYWLFSDAPHWRAPWCARFRCRDLGPLFDRPAEAPEAAREVPLPPPRGTLIIDSPGVERLQQEAAALPRPWWLIPHPVEAKRSWTLPLAAGDRCLRIPPEQVLPSWRGTVVVGESLMLLAALRWRRTGTVVRVALPRGVDQRLHASVRTEARTDPGVIGCD